VFGEAAAPSEARGGDTGLLPKRSKLNAKHKDILAKKRKQQEVCEENWCGMCRGGCGKRIMGQYVCDDCVRAKQEKAFVLQPGELELLRKDEGEKVYKQIVAIRPRSKSRSYGCLCQGSHSGGATIRRKDWTHITWIFVAARSD
jgi:hypothetical protein